MRGCEAACHWYRRPQMPGEQLEITEDETLLEHGAGRVPSVASGREAQPALRRCSEALNALQDRCWARVGAAIRSDSNEPAGDSVRHMQRLLRFDLESIAHKVRRPRPPPGPERRTDSRATPSHLAAALRAFPVHHFPSSGREAGRPRLLGARPLRHPLQLPPLLGRRRRASSRRPCPLARADVPARRSPPSLHFTPVPARVCTHAGLHLGLDDLDRRVGHRGRRSARAGRIRLVLPHPRRDRVQHRAACRRMRPARRSPGMDAGSRRVWDQGAPARRRLPPPSTGPGPPSPSLPADQAAGVAWASASAGTLLRARNLQRRRVLVLYPIVLLNVYFVSLRSGL